MAQRFRTTVAVKADSIRMRNNHIERLVSTLHGPRQEGDSVLLREVPADNHREIWNEAMNLLAEQFSEIQELIGMTR